MTKSAISFPFYRSNLSLISNNGELNWPCKISVKIIQKSLDCFLRLEKKAAVQRRSKD